MLPPMILHDGLSSIASGIGTTADKRSYHSYHFCKLPWAAVEARYRSSWLARKIIDIPSAEMCRPKRNWQAEGTDISALERVERDLGLWAKLEEALSYARMGGGLIVIGTPDTNMATPLNIETAKVTYLHVMTREDVSFSDFERDPGNPNFGNPRMYQVASDDRMVDIHPSRVIVFKGRRVPKRNANEWDAFWGDSELDAIDDAIRNADSAQNGFASLIEESKVDVWGIPELTTAFQTGEAEAALIRRFTTSNMLKSLHNAVIKDAQDTWETRQLNLAGVKDIVLTYISIVAGAASMPATVLMGKAPDGMNATGDGDAQNWERTLDGWRESILRPVLDYLDPMLKAAAGVTGDDVWWSFGPLREATEEEILTGVKTKAEIVKAAIDAGAPTEPLLKSLANAMVESEQFPGLDEEMDDFEAALEEMEAPDVPGEEAGLTQANTTTDAAPRPLYVSRKVQNAGDLKTWAKSQGLPELQDDLHVTIAYSTTPVDWIKMGQDYRDFNGKGTGELVIAAGGPRVVEPLGDRTAVLMFASSDLSWRNMEMREAGASWDHEDYQPHISLTGEPVDLANVEPYRGKIVLGPEVFEERQALTRVQGGGSEVV